MDKRFLPVTVRLRRLVESRALGELVHLEGQFSNASSAQGLSGGWRDDPREAPAGGLTGPGLHVLDALLMLGGPARSVRAQLIERAVDGHVLDAVSLMLELRCGATAQLSTVRGVPDYFRLAAFGSAGWAEVTDFGRIRYALTADRTVVSEQYDSDLVVAEILGRFARAVSGGGAPPVPVREMWQTTAALEAAFAAIRTGARQDVADVEPEDERPPGGRRRCDPPWREGSLVTWTSSPLWAEIYDLFHPVGESIGDVEYYLSRLGGPGRSVLEPACGNGRFLIPLLQAGHRADGSDSSPEMIEICRRHCAELGLAPDLRVADLRDDVEPEKYDAIVVPRGSLRQIDDDEGGKQALTSMFRGLVPGGRIIVDVRILPKFDTGPPQVKFVAPSLWTQQDFAVESDPHGKHTVIYARYEKWEDGSLVDAQVHRFAIRQWDLDEVVSILGEIGFVGVHMTADFNPLVHLSSVRNYYTVEATKPG